MRSWLRVVAGSWLRGNNVDKIPIYPKLRKISFISKETSKQPKHLYSPSVQGIKYNDNNDNNNNNNRWSVCNKSRWQK